MLLRSAPFTLLLAVLAMPLITAAQPDPPYPPACCFEATCSTCEEVEMCLNAPPIFDPWDPYDLYPDFFGPENAMSGGTGLCGIDIPGGALCSSFSENNFFGGNCVSCADPAACNYGVIDDILDYCLYPEAGYDCDGNCLNDANENGVCDEFEILGCTDVAACNFDTNANVEDGSCTYPEFGFNCDGSCSDDDGDGICLLDEIYGCTDSLAVNYYPIFTEDDGGCIYAVDLCDCPADMNGDNFITVADIIVILGLFEYSCE